MLSTFARQQSFDLAIIATQWEYIGTRGYKKMNLHTSDHIKCIVQHSWFVFLFCDAATYIQLSF